MADLPLLPHEATKLLLKKLSSRRMRDVLEKRYGLKGGVKKTLESIGKEYKITRERVRQIENDALKHLGKPENLAEIAPLVQVIESHIRVSGEVMAQGQLLSALAETKYHPHLVFLLGVGKPFFDLAESETHHERWTTNKNAAQSMEKIMAVVVADIQSRKKPLSKEELYELVSKNAKSIFGTALDPRQCEAYVNTSRLIRKNPYNEYGLVGWATITPSGMKDKAYTVLAKHGTPMHFKEVAKAIDAASWSRKRAHPQTVHNELIKDARFVLVGRGLYALREWGYEPGMVRDVLVSVLKEAKNSLTREEIADAVLLKRVVKVPTILLNLQNKTLFKRTEEGKYTLA